MIWKEQLNCNL